VQELTCSRKSGGERLNDPNLTCTHSCSKNRCAKRGTDPHELWDRTAVPAVIPSDVDLSSRVLNKGRTLEAKRSSAWGGTARRSNKRVGLAGNGNFL